MSTNPTITPEGDPVPTNDWKPTTKVAAGGGAGFITALITWLISDTGVHVPDGVLVYVPVVAAFLAGYFTPDDLVKYGRILRDSENEHTRRARHADNGDGVKDNAGA